MEFKEIENEIREIEAMGQCFEYWVDAEAFERENSEYAPGAIISKYGFYVIGTTVGGNAITYSPIDGKIRFCDHTGWYDDNMTFAAKRDYAKRPYSQDNVREAQIVLAENFEDLKKIIKSGNFDDLVDEYD